MNTKEILNIRAGQLSEIFGFKVKYYKGSKTYGRPHCFGPDEPCGEFNRHRVGLSADTAKGLKNAVNAFFNSYHLAKSVNKSTL